MEESCNCTPLSWLGNPLYFKKQLSSNDCNSLAHFRFFATSVQPTLFSRYYYIGLQNYLSMCVTCRTKSNDISNIWSKLENTKHTICQGVRDMWGKKVCVENSFSNTSTLPLCRFQYRFQVWYVQDSLQRSSKCQHIPLSSILQVHGDLRMVLLSPLSGLLHLFGLLLRDGEVGMDLDVSHFGFSRKTHTPFGKTSATEFCKVV